MSRLIDLDWFSVRAPVLVHANSSTLTALLIMSEAVMLLFGILYEPALAY